MTGKKKFDSKKWLLLTVAAFAAMLVIGFFIHVLYLVAKGQPFQETWQRYLAKSFSTNRLTSSAVITVITLGISLYVRYCSLQRVSRQSDQ